MIIQGFGKGGDARQPVIESEGITVNVAGNYARSSSKTKIEVLDLLGEGPMQGLVSGYYRMHGGYLGRTGWAEAEFIPYNDGILSGTNINSGVLRSVYYNNVPILDSSDKYNFSNIRFKFVNGTPMGATGVGAESIFDDELTITKQIGEQMLGPNYDFSNDGMPTDVLVDGNERFDKFRGDYDKLYARDQDAAIINRKVYRYYDKNIVAFDVNVRINSLNYSEIIDKDKYGDNLSYYLDYVIKIRPIFKNEDKSSLFSYETVKDVSLKGKVTTSPFLQSDRIEVDDFSEQSDFLAWELEIIRKTADAIHPAVTCNATVDSITQIYNQTFRYPNSAMASNLYDAEFFSEVPETSYDVEMLKVKVPDNFDPITRSYDGDWDGTFSTEKKWTSDPAWTFYDILTNKRYGVGNYIDEDLVDKWSLYQISQYCNGLVRDGYAPSESPYSGLEPRFETNVYLAQQDDAYQVINDLASVFRGMTYYIGGSIDVSQDAPKDPRFILTNANVVDGNFVYSSSSKKSRHTVALVRYNDKLNNYNPAVEYIEDPEGIRKYGLVQRDVTAIGCASRGQAFRLGKWILTTERTETETVNFQMGMDAQYYRPGDVIKIFDENKTKKRYSGRTLKTEIYDYPNASGAVITLDRKIPLHNYETYKFSLATPTYSYESSLVDKSSDFNSTNISGLKRGAIQEIYFTGGPTTISNNNGLTTMYFTGDSYTGAGMNQFNTGEYSVTNNLIFAIEQSGNIADNCEFELYKVIRVEEQDSSLYNIFAMQHNSGKFDIIETGLSFESSISAKNIGSPTINTIFYNEGECKLSFVIKKGENNRHIVMYARKDGEVFSTTVLPDSSLQASLKAIDSNDETVIIDYNLFGDNVDYDFAFWGTDGASFSNNGATYSSLNNGQTYPAIGCASSVCNFKVYSLRGKCQDSNASATDSTYIYEGTDPIFRWNLDYDTQFKLDENIYNNYETRLTYYEPDVVTVANGKLEENGAEIYRRANYGIAFDGEVVFTMGENILGHNNRSDYPKIGPFRSYDLVVDVIDKDNQKSSRDCNDEGFDVLSVKNPPPEVVTDINEYINDYTYTFPQGIVTFDFSSVDFEANKDYRGYIFYYKNQEFTQSDIETDLTINYHIKYFNDKYEKDILQRVSLKNAGANLYGGIILLDSFDQEAEKQVESRAGTAYIDKGSYYRSIVPTAERLTTIQQLTRTN